jgi:hypothetical protein
MAKLRSGRQGGTAAAATRPIGRRRARLARWLAVAVVVTVGAGCSPDRPASPSQAVAEDRLDDHWDDQGPSDRKSDAKATNLARRQAQGMFAPVRTARCGGRCSPTQALAPELIEAGPLGSARAGRRDRAQLLQ